MAGRSLTLDWSENGKGIRACFKIRRGPVLGQKAGWRGATREHTRQRSVTEEQRSQTAFAAKTLRAARLLPVAGVGSFLTARCGDARNSPPWPRAKSLAAGLLLILKQALSDRNTFLTCFTDERGSGLEHNLRVSSRIFAYSRLFSLNGRKMFEGRMRGRPLISSAA